MAEEQHCCGIKVQYLRIKSHFFLLQAALSAILPLLHVFGKQLGISAVSIGIIFATLPFLNVICKPIVGWVADYTKRLKLIVYILLAFLSICSVILIFIPMKDRSLASQVSCNAEGRYFSYVGQSGPECFENIPVEKKYYCFMVCQSCSSDNVPVNESSCENQSLSSNMMLQRTDDSLGVFKVDSFSLGSQIMSPTCITNGTIICNTTCDPAVQDCYSNKKDSGAGLTQLSMYIICVVILYLAASVSGTLADAACFNILGDRVDLYGQQRLWGTIGWGLCSPIIGGINYALTGIHFIQCYYGGFVAAPILLFFDYVILRNIEMDNLSMSKSIAKDIANLMRKPNVVLFIISAFMMGSLVGVLWTFLYWHLKMLSASVLLLGLVPAFECLIGEIPFFYFASKIIARIGHFHALSICFICFGIRFVAVSYLVDPWWVLPISILQGPTFGLFYATMATYANFAALPGTEVTVQGLVSGVYEGLGIASGSLLGGFIMENYQGSWLFFSAGLTAFVYAGINIIFSLYLKSWKEGGRSSIRCEALPTEETNFI